MSRRSGVSKTSLRTAVSGNPRTPPDPADEVFRARYALMSWLRLRKNIRNAYFLADLPFAGLWKKARFRMFCLLILVCLSLFWYSRICVSMLPYKTLLALRPTLAQLSAICEPLCAKAMKTQRRAQGLAAVLGKPYAVPAFPPWSAARATGRNPPGTVRWH